MSKVNVARENFKTTNRLYRLFLRQRVKSHVATAFENTHNHLLFARDGRGGGGESKCRGPQEKYESKKGRMRQIDDEFAEAKNSF